MATAFWCWSLSNYRRIPDRHTLKSAIAAWQHAARLAAGANAFLSKPIDVDQLLTRIGTLLRLDWIEAASDPGV
jgi:hypothetical protein